LLQSIGEELVMLENGTIEAEIFIFGLSSLSFLSVVDPDPG
jgi:hypothetical protein